MATGGDPHVHFESWRQRADQLDPYRQADQRGHWTVRNGRREGDLDRVQTVVYADQLFLNNAE